LRYPHPHLQNVNITFRYPHLHHFLLFASTRLLQLLSALIIQYPKIGNEPILKAFKNNFDRILVFWAYFENIMQHKKYVKSRRKKMG
jgi:hypothetical protein